MWRTNSIYPLQNTRLSSNLATVFLHLWLFCFKYKQRVRAKLHSFPSLVIPLSLARFHSPFLLSFLLSWAVETPPSLEWITGQKGSKDHRRTDWFLVFSRGFARNKKARNFEKCGSYGNVCSYVPLSSKSNFFRPNVDCTIPLCRSLTLNVLAKLAFLGDPLFLLVSHPPSPYSFGHCGLITTL